MHFANSGPSNCLKPLAHNGSYRWMKVSFSWFLFLRHWWGMFPEVFLQGRAGTSCFKITTQWLSSGPTDKVQKPNLFCVSQPPLSPLPFGQCYLFSLLTGLSWSQCIVMTLQPGVLSKQGEANTCPEEDGGRDGGLEKLQRNICLCYEFWHLWSLKKNFFFSTKQNGR